MTLRRCDDCGEVMDTEGQNEYGEIIYFCRSCPSDVDGDSQREQDSIENHGKPFIAFTSSPIPKKVGKRE